MTFNIVLVDREAVRIEAAAFNVVGDWVVFQNTDGTPAAIYNSTFIIAVVQIALHTT